MPSSPPVPHFYCCFLKGLFLLTKTDCGKVRISPKSRDRDKERSLGMTLLYKWQQIHHFKSGKVVTGATINDKLCQHMLLILFKYSC